MISYIVTWKHKPFFGSTLSRETWNSSFYAIGFFAGLITYGSPCVRVTHNRVLVARSAIYQGF